MNSTTAPLKPIPVASTLFCSRADPRASTVEASALHSRLASFGALRLAPSCPDDASHAELDLALTTLEDRYVARERSNISRLADEAPTEVEDFVVWYESLRETGPGQWDPLFDWIETTASFEQMRWFVRQEVVGEAGFDDLIALTQLRMPTTAKLEMARNYWDEMGRGRVNAMHGPMLGRAAEILNTADESLGPLLWESKALGNLLVALATNRRYAFHSAGALGAVELTAPTRTAKVAKGMARLGIAKEASHYFALHATIDLTHSEDWVKNVIRPLVAEDPRRARWIAEGALMRLNAGARCFDRYRAHFGLGGSKRYIEHPIATA